MQHPGATVTVLHNYNTEIIYIYIKLNTDYSATIMWLGNSIQTKQLRDFVENMGTHSSAHLSPHSPRAKSSSFKPPFTIEIIIYYRISPLFIDDFPIQTRHL
jgi:hypothetical protein